VQRNMERERIVPEDIVLNTHEGAATTMADFISKGLPAGMDGSVHVILNNPEQTVTYGDSDETVIKDFKYLTLKNPGEKMKNSREVKKQLALWIKRNAPQTSEIWKKLNTKA